MSAATLTDVQRSAVLAELAKYPMGPVPAGTPLMIIERVHIPPMTAEYADSLVAAGRIGPDWTEFTEFSLFAGEDPSGVSMRVRDGKAEFAMEVHY